MVYSPADALKIARAMSYPPGYGLELAGASRDQQEVFKQMGIALVSGIALMYLVLVMQFGSFTAPLAVMMSLPLSLIGVVLALLATGGTLNLYSALGMLVLFGVVKKNSILQIDHMNGLRAKGLPVALLVFEGEQHGFRKAETVIRALEAELWFYGAVFGFVPADVIEPVEVANLNRPL